MPRYSYDLHLHSCLSPCAEPEMTPPNIVNMAALKGLNLIALTDHNSARNVAATVRAAAGLPLTVIPGMELCTAEEIHIVCLFPTVAAAEAAGREAERCLPPIDNRPDIFGDQEVRDEQEQLTGTVDRLLINATSLSIDDLPEFMARYGGVCYPAHIDKSSNSILATFGCLPPEPDFAAVEVAHPDRFSVKEHWLQDRVVITSSDAHRLEDISEPEHFLELERCDFASLAAVLRRNG
ncbi:MAG: PHP domain-containing protein [Angelakisella sp.]